MGMKLILGGLPTALVESCAEIVHTTLLLISGTSEMATLARPLHPIDPIAPSAPAVQLFLVPRAVFRVPIV